MSAECERLFSAADDKPLRSWLRAGLIDELDPILLSVEDNRGDEGNGDNTNATEPAREEAGWE